MTKGAFYCCIWSIFWIVTSLPFPWNDDITFDRRQEQLLESMRREPIALLVDESLFVKSSHQTYKSPLDQRMIHIRNDAGELVEVMMVDDEEMRRRQRQAQRKKQEAIAASYRPANPLDLVNQIPSLCMVLQLPGEYWAVEYCHRKEIRQFHVEQDTSNPSKVLRSPDWSLGTYISTNILRYGGDNTNESAPIRKVIDKYVDGQYCDETKAGRETSVHLQCCRKPGDSPHASPKSRSKRRKADKGPLPKFADDQDMEGLGDMDDARAAETAGLSEATRAVLLRDNLAKQYIDDEDPINMYHGSSAKAVGHTVALKGIVEKNICSYQMKVCVDFLCPTEEELEPYRTSVKPPLKSKQSATSTDESANENVKEGIANEQPERGSQEMTLSLFLGHINNTCLFRQEEWWTYELCFNKGIRQYHAHATAIQQADGKIIQTNEIRAEFSLGYPPLHLYDDLPALTSSTTFKNTNSTREIVNPYPTTLGMPPPNILRKGKGMANNLHLEFTEGTKCDIKATTRSSTVELSCGPREILKDIKEDSTCHYVVVVESPLLCKVPSFQPQKSKYALLEMRVLENSSNSDDDKASRNRNEMLQNIQHFSDFLKEGEYKPPSEEDIGSKEEATLPEPEMEHEEL